MRNSQVIKKRTSPGRQFAGSNLAQEIQSFIPGPDSYFPNTVGKMTISELKKSQSPTKIQDGKIKELQITMLPYQVGYKSLQKSGGFSMGFKTYHDQLKDKNPGPAGYLPAIEQVKRMSPKCRIGEKAVYRGVLRTEKGSNFRKCLDMTVK